MKQVELTNGKKLNLEVVSLKGKEYMPVAQRLIWFREENKHELSITTELLSVTDKRAVAKATISKGGIVLSQGTKAEDIADFKDFIEKAETGSIGRALAHLGYGTQFAPELEEGERIVDAPQSKVVNLSPQKEYNPYPDIIKSTIKINGIANDVVLKLLKDTYNVDKLVKLTPAQSSDFVKLLNKIKEQ